MIGGSEIILIIFLLLITQIPAIIFYRRSNFWQKMYHQLSEKIIDKSLNQNEIKN